MIHSFIFDIDQPQVLYTAEECGHISRVDLRLQRVDLLYKNYRNSRNLCSVKALAQSSSIGSTQLVVGGQGFTVGMLDLRLLQPPAPVMLGRGALAGDSSPRRQSQFVRIWSPLFCSPKTGLPALEPIDWDFDANSMGSLSPGLQRREQSVSISGLQISSNGRSMVASYQGDQIYVYDLLASTVPAPACKDRRISEKRVKDDGVGPIACLGGHINYATFLKTVSFFGPKDEYVLSGSDSGHLWVWETDSGTLLTKSRDPKRGIIYSIPSLFAERIVAKSITDFYAISHM